jgi:hypothetical protein
MVQTMAMGRVLMEVAERTRRRLRSGRFLGGAEVSRLAEPFEKAPPSFVQKSRALPDGSRSSARFRGFAGICLAASLAGCGAEPGAGDEDAYGIATARLDSVPDDVTCLAINVTGNRTTQRLRDVTPGQSASFTLNGLPVGNVIFLAEGFAESCSLVNENSLATWLSEPTPATLVAGVNTPVELRLRRNGVSDVVIDFDDEPLDGDPGGGPTCSADTADCNLDPIDGCEVDLLTDPTHCGACGNACAAGVGAPTCSNARCIVTVATSPGTPSDLAIDSTDVYWVIDDFNNGAVLKAPKTGGGSTLLAPGQHNASSIAVDGTSVYWTARNISAVMKIGKDGAGLFQLASVEFPKHLAIDASSVYYITHGGVWKVGLNGGLSQALASTSNAHDVAVDGNWVYWSTFTDNTLMRVPVSGGPVTTLHTSQNPVARLTLSQTHVYWLGGNSLTRTDKNGANSQVLYTSTHFLKDLVADSTHVYVTTSAGANDMVVGMDLDGGNPTVLGADLGNLQSIAVDDASVYWGTTDGFVYRTEKL